MAFNQVVAKYLPFLGKYKRVFVAIKHSLFPKNGFAQHGEDIFFKKYINDHKIDVKQFEYIDVGANHPTDISNTYLLYRMGMRGTIVEPNRELVRLFKWFRKEDRALEIGVSNTNTVLEFFISKTPVISSFKKDWMSSEVMKSTFVPILTLDNAVENLIEKPIFLLSIDVEGLNLEVLEGAKNVVQKSLLVCLEYDDEAQKNEFLSILGSDFKLLTTLSCNIILENKLISKNLINGN